MIDGQHVAQVAVAERKVSVEVEKINLQQSKKVNKIVICLRYQDRFFINIEFFSLCIGVF
jgi:hypothetical protein